MDENQTELNNDQNTEVTLEKLQTDLDAAMNGWKRTAADFDNYRKRKEAENQELILFAREAAVVKLLPILDSLEQALRHIPQYSSHSDNNSDNSGRDFAVLYQNWQNGAKGIVTQLDKTLEELGVKKIAAIGKKFDPHVHEAVKEVETDDVADGIIIDELQSGFELNGKLIRPSQVIISKKKS